MNILLPTAYLPPVYYVAKMLTADRVLIEQHDHYAKQTYRNRCTIAGPGGPLHLTVPIVHLTSADMPMRDIRISDHGNWRHLHWNALESAYGHSPFFFYYADDFRPLYEQRIPFLMDLNEALLNLVLRLIGASVPMRRTARYLPDIRHTSPSCWPTCPPKTSGTNLDESTPATPIPTTDALQDLRPLIHPRRDYWLDDPTFHATPYYQVFQDRLGFLPNLSIVDLLFNMGPESIIVLRQCAGLATGPSSVQPPASTSQLDRLEQPRKLGQLDKTTPSSPFVSPHPLFNPHALKATMSNHG